MFSDAKVKCFLTAAQAESFSAAAAKLYISQQAVSKHIADLEEELGTRLFMRDRKHISLTAEGRKAAEWFTEYEKSFAALLTELASTEAAESSSEIRIAYQNWMEFGKAPAAALTKLRMKYPAAVLHAERHSPSGLIDKLIEGKIDIALIHKRFLQGRSPELMVAQLFETPMMLSCSTDYPGAETAEVHTDFAGAPMIIDRLGEESDADAASRARREAGSFGFVPGEIIVVPNRDSVYEEAELGRGVFFGSQNTQTPPGSRLVKYPTGRYDSVCAISLRANKKRRVARYINLLAEEYAASASAVES